MRLEIRDVSSTKDLKFFRAFLDGVLLENVHTFDLKQMNKGEGYLILSQAYDTVDPLLHVHLDEVDPRTCQIRAIPDLRLNEFRVYVSAYKQEGVWATVKFELTAHLNYWKNPWSAIEFAQELLKHSNDLYPLPHEHRQNLTDSQSDIYVAFRLGDNYTTLQDEMGKHVGDIENLLVITREKLLASLSEASLVQPFNFPEEVRTSCEQYLLYFVQFLKDVGIDANAQIRHEGGEAGQVLFSVTPADGKQALDKGRQALELYLKLSQSPTGRPNFSARPEVQSLQRQIRYLQNELDFAEEKIAQKNITLELREAQVAQLRERQVFDQAQPVPAEKKNDEPEVVLFKGTVKLKRLDAKIADVDVPQIYRLLEKWIVGPYRNETLISYLGKNGFRFLERDEPALPPSQDLPALPAADEDKTVA